MNPALIILGVVVIILIYMYFFYSTGAKVLSNKLDLTTQQPEIAVDKIDNPTSISYAFECWVYIGAYTNNSSKYIFSRIATSNAIGKNIGLQVSGASPTLTVEYVAAATPATKKTLVITDNFPVQSWVHVIVSINNSYIDTYINGKLTKSINVTGGIEIPSSSSSIQYGQLSNWQIAKFTRYTSPVDPQTAWEKYSAGNGSNPVSKYLGTLGMDISLKKDNLEYSKLNVF